MNHNRLNGKTPEKAEVIIRLPRQDQGADIPVIGGHFTLCCEPKTDLMHPFDGHSLIMDVMACPEGLDLIKKRAPTLYALAADPMGDVAVKRFDEISWGVPKAARREADALIPDLKKITW